MYFFVFSFSFNLYTFCHGRQLFPLDQFCGSSCIVNLKVNFIRKFMGLKNQNNFQNIRDVKRESRTERGAKIKKTEEIKADRAGALDHCPETVVKVGTGNQNPCPPPQIHT